MGAEDPARRTGAARQRAFGDPTCNTGKPAGLHSHGDLAKRYPRPQSAKGKAYARHKT